MERIMILYCATSSSGKLETNLRKYYNSKEWSFTSGLYTKTTQYFLRIIGHKIISSMYITSNDNLKYR